jgi:flagellar basal-body rod modification protein FlgD
MSLLSILDHVKQAVASPFDSQPKAQANGVKAMASSSAGNTGATGASTNQATITANDFLTLLVTEIQNQDPTTQTDPMQYITQLVGVNSLEQLVQINQTLTTAAGTTTPAASGQSRSHAATSVAASTLTALPTAATQPPEHLLPLGSNTQISAPSQAAVAQALTQASTLTTQAPPTTQMPLNPAVMRALERSIPGASYTGASSSRAGIQTETSGTVR